MNIKNILLTLLASASFLSAGDLDRFKPVENMNYYFGGSISDADETLVECRASLIAAADYEFNDFFAAEARYTYGLGEHYSAYEAFIKPKYKDASLLLGYGNTNYLDHDIDFNGFRAGLQYNILGPLHVDFIHRFKEEDTSITCTLKF